MIGKGRRSKKPLSEAQLQQRRNAAKRAGQPRLTPAMREIRKATAAVRKSAIDEAEKCIEILKKGRDGDLEGSDAKSQQAAAVALLKIAGISE